MKEQIVLPSVIDTQPVESIIEPKPVQLSSSKDKPVTSNNTEA